MPPREQIKKWYENRTLGNVYRRQRKLLSASVENTNIPPPPLVSLGKAPIDLVIDEPLNIDITGTLSSMKVLVLLFELVKIPSVRDQIIEQLHLQGMLQEKQQAIN